LSGGAAEQNGMINSVNETKQIFDVQHTTYDASRSLVVNFFVESALQIFSWSSALL
jgi:hypothetical protein